MAGETSNNHFQSIDIREVVASKNKKLAGRLPFFIYNWLERILHLKEVNSFLKSSGHHEGIDFANEVINYLNIKFNINGIENIPKEGRYMFVSNHPLGGLDGVLLLKIINENTGKTRVLINDFLMAITPMEKWFVPVNKVGGQARGAIKAVDELYQSKDHVLIFPAGLCSRMIKGKVIDLVWHKHFIQKSVQHQMNVVPIFFGGNNSKRFYRLAKLRKFFKIKFNIEMMYLADELYKHKNRTFDIYFGKPIPYTTFDKSQRPLNWAQKVKDEVYKLAKSQ